MRLVPGVLIGSLSGAMLLAFINVNVVILTFAVFLLFSAWRMAGLRSTSARNAVKTPLPGYRILGVKGAFIGLASALVGVGGGILTVPVMSAHTQIRIAVGTAAALGVPISLAAGLGYLMPSSPVGCGYCMGYVFLPVVLATGAATLISAPLGARVAHILPQLILRRLFAILLVSVAADLIYKSLT